MSLKSFSVGAVIFALGSAAPAFATEYLTNGSFETGDFTGWTYATGGDPNFSGVVPSTVTYNGQGAQDGNYYALVGATTLDNASLSQSFVDTPNETLTITGWITGDGSEPSFVTFSFNGAALLTVNPVPNEPWTQVTVTATATGNDIFSVGFGNDPFQDGLDNFSVSSVSGVPEPTTWALLLIGFAGLGLIRYRSLPRMRCC